MEEKSGYMTKDLAEAAFLYASNRKLSGLENESGKYWFVFENYRNCQQLSNKYWQKEAKINAKEYSDAIRSLKDLIFNKRRR
jgi:hypothetical protein